METNNKIFEEKPKSSLTKVLEILSTMASKPSGFIGLAILIFHVVLAVTSPWVVPYDYKSINPTLMLQAPSLEYWFGTDSLGRDVFTRTILGGRTALTVTFFGSIIALLWGGLLGIFCGLVGGRIDDIVMRIVDAFLSIPWILAMLLIVSLLGTSTEVLIPALGFFYGKGIVRVARAATHDVIAKDFIVSAKARGHSNLSIIWNEILPNVRDAILVEGAMRWSWMLLGFSSLSFLGFGVSPPTPDWGLMISNARGLMSFAWWAVISPIVGLSTLIIGINLTADAFAKALGIDRSTKAPV
ncbi:ABC transporter permease [Candidatus Pelagibacter sp.]|nr:ABC transporter permease [Candidatus Pelagibacter sp.]